MANEKRLIDANKVIGAMQKCLDESPDKKDSVAYFAFESIIECLKQEPTVDAVEVVRCKDCKYGNNFCARGKRKSTYCQRLGKQPVRMEQDDFCSCGERKGDGNG